MFLRFAMIGTLAFAAATAQAEPLRVAVSQRGFWDSSFVDMAIEQGFFKKENLEIQTFYTEGGATTLDAVMSGSVDIAMSNGLLGVVGRYAKGAPLRVIAAEFTGGSDAFWYARADSGIKSLKDAEGKTVAFSSNGSSTNLMILGLLKLAGVTAKPTPTGGAPGTYVQVNTKQIDIGWSVPPLALQDVLDNKLVIVARGSDLPDLANQTVRVNVAMEPVLKTKRDAMQRFMKVYNATIAWAYTDPKGLEYFAKENKISTEVAKKALEFYPQAATQTQQVKGLDQTVRDAIAFKYLGPSATTKDLAGLIDIVEPGPK
ncbi:MULTISPECIES: ABC transporter substrate-binding protein [unclassified Beijerinckia]|uniref:ABC transporter substrate-binding protein n=1 Tax=unclassified Beijerinckia TaxID=2638183 RepID=UPI00089C1729|nr:MULTISPECIES: ABC transporter substrate-binding protein [unclassified Beijerinckia]MDH7795388.1 NitT/TauT family transport system substrate-binding protein [Beijerinckia sp. GAS462]SEB99530.1 NitT/TauT family transport system substrate-binding protein [Beijerinckia sp. 28-YEA-48]